MTRIVIREWRGERHLGVEVLTRHLQGGPVWRGTITAVPSPDWRGVWRLVAYDYTPVGDGPFVGDYLDAEAALLDATAALDEELPDHEL